MATHAFRYGRKLDDFAVGATYAHPWEVTLDGGTLALAQGSFLDACPTYSSAATARALGLRDRPVHPLVLVNLGLSFSVHDVSEQAIAHLAYLDVRYPFACYPGDTVVASSTVLGVKAAQSGDRGVVHVRTVLETTEGTPVCVFERKALVRAGSLAERPVAPGEREAFDVTATPRVPSPLASIAERPAGLHRRGGLRGFYEDFDVGDVYAHQLGKTVGESEHMQLTLLFRNSHPLHFDEVYCKEGASFAGTRVVYGGLVFAWVASLASRDVAGHAIWDVGYDDGAHPAGVVAGDTIFAASKVLGRTDAGEHAGDVTFRLVGTKNVRPEAILARGADLFAPELTRDKADKIAEKVFEITRTLRVWKRP